MANELTAAQRIYDQLCSESAATLASGMVRVDPFLQGKAGDPRRGATLVARPGAQVRTQVEAFLREAAVICPGQHIYQPSEFHVTVLAIIPGSESWRDEYPRLPVFQGVLGEVLKDCPPFSLKFRGVTASPEAVLVQGVPPDDGLAQLRDRLRKALRNEGVGENLDRRYKIAAAHLTVMRFANPEGEWKRLFDFLQAHRETDFGETRFNSLQLIWGDWCASAGVVRVLQEYALRD